MLRGVPLPALPALALALHGAGCAPDPSYLGKDPPGTSTTTTSTTGAGGSGGKSAGAGGAGGGDPVEPPGPTKLTVLNGINDHQAIRLCFLPYPDGDGAGVSPWPAGASALGFARGAAISPIDAVIPPGADARPHVIAGDLGATAGLDCAELLALAEGGQGPVVAAALPVLPAQLFEAERSLLLVPVGCLGGPGHTDPAEETGCGKGYTAETPTVSLVAAPMSRLTETAKVALQIAHASVATPEVDVRVTTGTDPGSEWQVAPELSLGAIGPFPPFVTLSAAQYGVLADAQIRTYAPGTMNATSTVPMSEVLARSDVSATDFTDGHGFALVAVGAAPGTGAGPFWHALTYALVPADP